MLNELDYDDLIEIKSIMALAGFGETVAPETEEEAQSLSEYSDCDDSNPGIPTVEQVRAEVVDRIRVTQILSEIQLKQLEYEDLVTLFYKTAIAHTDKKAFRKFARYNSLHRRNRRQSFKEMNVPAIIQKNEAKLADDTDTIYNLHVAEQAKFRKELGLD